jgi:lysophospholipase L1-like esterase
MRSRRWLPRVLLAALGVLLALVAGEVILRARSPLVRRYEVWWPHLHKVLRPGEGILPGVEGEKHFVVNSLGMRGSELDAGDDFRILTVGASTTECLFLDQDEAWPERVGALLEASGRLGDVWVGNAGKSGLNTRDHVVQMRRLVPQLRALELDLVVYMVGVNDFTLRLGQDEDYDPSALERPAVVSELVRRVFQRVPLAEEPRLPFWKRSALYVTLGRVRDRHFGGTTVQDDAARAHDLWRANRASATRFLDELPDLTSALGEYRRNLGELIGLAREVGPRVLLLTQPSLWRDDNDEQELACLWLGGIGPFMTEPGCVYYAPRALLAGLARYNAETVEVARERGVEALDLAAAIPRDLEHFYDDVHFNERGSELVAQVVADYLLAGPASSERAPR